MFRTTLCMTTVLFSLGGCFSEPPGAALNGSSSGAGDTTEAGTTSPSSTGDETTLEFSSTGFSTGFETTSGTTFGTTFGTSSGSSGLDDSSSTGDPPPPLCGCPKDPLVFCEDFETFADGTFPGWAVPSPGKSPMQVAGVCGDAFRGDIIGNVGSTVEFAVLSRRQLDILEGGTHDEIRLTGLMRIEAGCAEFTVHRLLSARVDTELENYQYSAELEIANDTLSLVQRLPDPQAATSHEIGLAEFDTWVRFEIALYGLVSGEPPMVRASVSADGVDVPRPPLPPDETISFSTVPGPFAPLDPTGAGCTVDFDDIALQVFPEPP